MLDKGTCLRFYKRKDIQEAMVAHAKQKEIGLRYNESFGKRPDIISYPKEIIELALRGVTSFHASEELWENPLELESSKSKKELDELRVGWDLVLDIDCKFIDYSKIAADLIIQFLKYCGVKDISCKFSVTGDTPLLIKMNQGIELLAIKKVIELLKAGEKIEVLSLDDKGYVCFSKITGHLEHKEKVHNIFHENSKLPLRVTKYHSVFAWEKSEIIQKEVEKLKPGDNLITYRKTGNISQKADFNFEWEFEFLKKKMKRKVKITREILLLLGYYLAEGHITKIIDQIGFSFNVNEVEYIEECISLLEKITSKKVSIRHPNKNTTQILIHSREWYYFFEKTCGKGAKNKHLPAFSWELPKEYFEQLLLGYIRGDGYKLGEYSITVKSVSHQLIKELVWLCNLNDISCSINQEYNKEHYLPQGTLFKGSHVFSINIHKSELASMEFFRNRNKYSPYLKGKTFPVDGLRKVYQQIKPKSFNRHRAEQMTLRKKSANLERIKKVLKWFEEFKSEEYDLESKKIVQNYNQLLKNNVVVLEVKKIIQTGEEEVYDICVERTERFFGGCYPILLHNSGNKGFHIGVPFEAFPKKVGEAETKDLFPDAAKRIAFYIKENIKTELSKRILEFEGSISKVKEKVGLESDDIIRYESNEFGDKIATLDVDKFLEIDTVLISSRHLYRMPYSLHEKSGLVSLLIDPDKVMEFQKDMAKPDSILTPMFTFLDRDVSGESARQLLVQALDFDVKLEEEKEHTKKEYDELKLTSPIKEDFFPPCMKLLLQGIGDGKKRGVFILMNYLGKIGWNKEEIEAYLKKWNTKNKEPLREVYIKGQLHNFKAGDKLPPNCNNEAYYKGIGVCRSDSFCPRIKNPVNYTILKWKRHLQEKEEQEE